MGEGDSSEKGLLVVVGVVLVLPARVCERSSCRDGAGAEGRLVGAEVWIPRDPRTGLPVAG